MEAMGSNRHRTTGGPPDNGDFFALYYQTLERNVAKGNTLRKLADRSSPPPRPTTMISRPQISRRAFLRRTTLAAAACCTLSRSAFGADEPEILGQGDHRYRAVPNWGVLDNDTPVNDCHAMVQDKRGRLLLLTNESRNNVIIYDRGGKLLGTWGHDFPGAHGMTLVNENGEEFLFLTDYARHQVYKTTLDGRVLLTLDAPFASGRFVHADQYKPTHVIAAPDGSFYVLDGYGTSLVLHYDAKGGLLGVFGGRGKTPGSINEAHGGSIDPRDPARPTLLITSRQDGLIKRFGLDGTYLGNIALPNTLPCDVVFAGNAIYIPQLRMSDGKSTGFLTILDLHDRVISNPGGASAVYNADGTLQPLQQTSALFKHPHGLVVDEEGSIYVAQWNSGQTYPIKLVRA